MRRLISAVFAAAFAVATVSPVAFAQDKKAADKVAAACKGKKAGETVKVDGKAVKCPEAMKK